MRTIEEIKTQMEAAQASIPELSSLNSTSQVSFFGHLKNMWALLVLMVEFSWQAKKAEIETLLNNKRTGSAAWYVEQVKAFQFGYKVTIVNNQAGYSLIDPEAQIVKQAACVEDPVSGRLLIKAVKAANAVSLTALSADEMTALKAYLNEIKFAGVQIDVSSLMPDQLRLFATCKYDRMVLDSDGSLLSDPTKFPVRDAIQLYLRSLPFNSVVSWTDMTDYLQGIPGVKDFVVASTEIAPFATNFWVAFQRETVSNAGHLIFSEGNITYV